MFAACFQLHTGSCLQSNSTFTHKYFYQLKPYKMLLGTVTWGALPGMTDPTYQARHSLGARASEPEPDLSRGWGGARSRLGKLLRQLPREWECRAASVSRIATFKTGHCSLDSPGPGQGEVWERMDAAGGTVEIFR